MIRIDINSNAYRKYYEVQQKENSILFSDTDSVEELIDPLVRDICVLINNSGFALTRFCCEGHPSPRRKDDGYIQMLVDSTYGKNELLRIFELVQFKTIEEFGWLNKLSVSTGFNSRDQIIWYPNIVVRTPSFNMSHDIPKYWKVVTDEFREQIQKE